MGASIWIIPPFWFAAEGFVCLVMMLTSLNSYLAVLLIYGNNFSFFVFIFAGDDLYSIALFNFHGRH